LEMNEWLWSESQSRMLVSLPEKSMFLLDRVIHTYRVPVSYIGRVGGDDLVIDDILNVPVKEMNQAWRGSLKCLIS
jgi:phosphoribosylformylglycinamidine synthase subunit PurL